VVADFGQFAGKVVFGSQSTTPTYYLTTLQFSGGNGTSKIPMPAMGATSITDQERCQLYVQPDGTLRIQLGGLLWINLNSDLGWLKLSADFSQAAAFVLGGSPLGQTWQVETPLGLESVYYTAGGLSPILTIHSGGSALANFSPQQVTPTLAEILQTKSAVGGNFRNVNLLGQDLSGVDFTDADFSSANLSGVKFGPAILTGAVFRQAVLAGMTCDGATLDQADFTHADMTGLSWGSPKSAKGLILTNCFAQGAVLGGQETALDCTGNGLSLALGDFRGADLRGMNLSGAAAGGAMLAGCQLDNAILDGANLTGVVALGASFRGASLRGVTAQNASFVKADFSFADLTRAKMGAKAWLFSLPNSFVKELNENPYAPQDLVGAFATNGVNVSLQHAITVIAKGQRWEIQDAAGPYVLSLSLNPAGSIDVFNANPNLVPAVLTDAICLGTKAPSASLSCADLRRVQWYNEPATLDHADLEGAALVGSLLEAIDFTQAYLSGADLSGCVLVQAKFKGCILGRGPDKRAFSLEGALLQGADFSNTTLLGASLVDAAVALPQGVPLFDLPLSAQQDLTLGGGNNLKPYFDHAGYPLGGNPTISQLQVWLIDNSQDPIPSSLSHYSIKTLQAQLMVCDADAGTTLFVLLPGYASQLNLPTASRQLAAAFVHAGYSLANSAPITSEKHWEIRTDSDAPQVRAAAYPTMMVYQGGQQLPVFGCILVSLRDWPQFASGLAFGATVALQQALNRDSLGPSGYPRAWMDLGRLDWQALVTAQLQRGAQEGTTSDAGKTGRYRQITGENDIQ